MSPYTCSTGRGEGMGGAGGYTGNPEKRRGKGKLTHNDVGVAFLITRLPCSLFSDTNEFSPLLQFFFPPVAIKTHRLASSVVHPHALGQNISLSGRHTIAFIRELYL